MRSVSLPLSAFTLLLANPALAATEAEVLDTYSDVAQAAYGDALVSAERLQVTVAALVDDPSADTLAAARTAWLAARVPYQQTEAFRFGNAIVDDWEGRVNAWPLDEGLIDYVDPSYGGAGDENAFRALDVVSTPTFMLSGREVDATTITPALLADTLREADGIEANVATGYHAIEFLLWGQDLHGTAHGAGERPWTDYATGDACTHGNCDRRGQYLTAATDLLVSDLDWMTAQWAEGGDARSQATVDGILTGMGSLSYGELAGQRMKLGVLLNDPEEEHDCFSDNTHNSYFYDGIGIRNVYLGRYVGIDGTVTEGPSVSDLVAAADPEVDAGLRSALNATVSRLSDIRTVAEAGTSYDQMLAADEVAGEALILSAVDALVAQTREVERAVTVLGRADIAFEGSDSLDAASAPGAVFE